MENKCLVIQVDASFGDNFPKLGVFSMTGRFATTDENISGRFEPSVTYTVKSSRSVILATQDKSTIYAQGTEFTFTVPDEGHNQRYLFAESAGKCKIEIDNKDSISNITINTTLMEIDIDYMVALEGFSLSTVEGGFEIKKLQTTGVTNFQSYGNGNSKGDISELPDNDFTSIAIQGNVTNNRVTGNISKFANMVNLTSIQMQDSNLNGNIECLHELTKLQRLGFVRNQQIEGDACVLLASLFNNPTPKRSGTLNLFLSGSLCTINGDAITGNITAVFGENNIVATMNNSTYTYNGVDWTKT